MPVGGLDHVPGRGTAVRPADRALGGLGELVVQLEALPVGRRGVALLLQALERLFLLLFREVQAEFQEERAVIHQHRLKGGDAIELSVKLAAFDLVVDAVDDRVAVPGAEEDADAAAAGHGAPEAPVGRPFLLLVARLPERVRLDAARIEPFVQPVDQLAFAGAICA